MKVTVLGTGASFSLLNGNVSYLLEEDGRRLLLDAGRPIPEMLKENGIDIKSIDDIYISHLHCDHIGGLEFIALSRYDWVNRPKVAFDPPFLNSVSAGVYFVQGKVVDISQLAPALIGNHKLLEELWNKSLAGGLETMEGFEASLNTYFRVRPVQSNETFEWQGWTCKLIQQIHIMSGSVISSTFGLFMTKSGHKSLYFVTDSQHCSPRQIEIFYKEADVIFQDCELTGLDTKTKTMKFSSGVHANYAQLAGYKSANSVILSDDIKAKMWLTHYQDFFNSNKDFYGNDVAWQELAKDDGFKGFLVPGQVFEFKNNLEEIESWLESDEAVEKKREIEESSEKLSKSIKDSSNISDELLKKRIDI